MNHKLLSLNCEPERNFIFTIRKFKRTNTNQTTIIKLNQTTIIKPNQTTIIKPNQTTIIKPNQTTVIKPKHKYIPYLLHKTLNILKLIIRIACGEGIPTSILIKPISLFPSMSPLSLSLYLSFSRNPFKILLFFVCL